MNASNTLRRMTLLLGLSAAILGMSPVVHADDVVTASDDNGGATWKSIENDTYQQRDHFAAGARQLSARLDAQIQELKAKRATMSSDTKDWDLAMKAIDEARSLLTSRLTELAQKTTPEAWAAAKDNVGQAWLQSQQLVDKMNGTVTN